MCLCDNTQTNYSRRDFLTRTSLGLGALTIGSLLDPTSLLANVSPSRNLTPHFPAKAKRVIYLFQSGAPSQIDLFDDKPLLTKLTGQELPESIRKGQRLTGMTAGQASFPLVGPQWKFQKHGESGATISELLPYISEIADDLCFVKSMYTEAINHDPAITFYKPVHNFQAVHQREPGLATDWDQTMKTCRHTLCWLLKISLGSPFTPGYGAMDFCHPSTKVCSFGLEKTRYFTLLILLGFPERIAECNWIV